jgi:branched-chain amino acid transport system permease protein
MATLPQSPVLRGLIWLVAIVAASVLAFLLTSYQTDVYRKMLVWVALALGYNFLFGIAGQVAFSHFAFAGVGAYAMVILAFKLGIPFPVAFVLAIVLCAILALIVAIPSTRLEGFYLALATLAFAQLVLVVLNEGGTLTGGTGGLTNYRLPPVFGFELRGPWYTILLVLLVAFTLWLLLRLDHSAFGRACRAIRDNAQAAQAMGVDVARTKVIAFTVTSTLAGLAGIGYAFVDDVINPPVFGLENIFLLLFMIIVGGTGRHAGAIVGTVFLYLAPFLLEPIVGHHFMLVFGFLVVLAILFQPAGLIGLVEKLTPRGRA